MTIKACIIDDELPTRDNLRAMLNALCPNIEICDEGEDVISGLKIIRETRPQIIFLDIQMPDGTGFDLLNRLEFSNFCLIFLTAHNDYAVKAFKYSAMDYLLKPLDPDELIRVVEKATKTIEQEKHRLAQDHSILKKRLILKTTDSIHIVPVMEIIRCEANCNYTTFYLTDNKKIMVSKSLKEYESNLLPSGFFRTHQSHLINLNQITRISKIDGNTVIMSDQSSVPISSRKKEALLKALDAE